MIKFFNFETARRRFAEITGELEDAAAVAVEGQGAADLEVARQTSDRLIADLKNCRGRLRDLRSSLQ